MTLQQRQTVTLKDLCTIKTGKRDANHGNPQGAYPFFTCADEISRIDDYNFEGDSILIAGNGNFNVKHYSGKFDAYQRTYVLQNFKGNYKFYYYFILANLRDITKGHRGSTVQYIRLANLTDYPVPVFTDDEQNKIVEKIEELFSEVEDGISKISRSSDLIKIYRESVIVSAFKPYVSTYKKISDLGKVSGGLTKNGKRALINTTLPYLRVGNVYANKLDLNRIEEIGVTSAELDRVLLKTGDLLVVEGNGSPDQIGRVAVWDGSIDPCVHQNHIIKIRFSEITTSRFVMYWLMSVLGRREIKQVASSTSGLYTLSISKISFLNVPSATLEQQEKTIQYIEEHLSELDHDSSTLDVLMKLTANQQQSILNNAFKGGLI